MDSDEINIGGSSYWIFITLVSITTLVFLLLWSFHNNSVKGVVVSLIFLTMIIVSILFSRLKIFDMSSWGDNALSFTLGFGIWAIVGLFLQSNGQSIISFGDNNLFATIASELPQLMEFSVNVFLVPIAEEMFWMIGLPFALITIMHITGKRFSLFSKAWFQILVVAAIGGITFAMFHVGKWFVGFIISAIIFRTVMIVLVYGEHKYDILKGINVVAAFSVGAHIANNMSTVGLSQSWLIISSNFWPVGLLIILFMALMLLSGLERLISLIAGGKAPQQTFTRGN